MSDNQVIPEAAVEAAARVLIEDGKYGVPWEDATEEDQAETKDYARRILEEAAPHMLRAARADAWDEGAEYNDDSGMYVRDHNPYRHARG